MSAYHSRAMRVDSPALPAIPMRHAPWFQRALWLLALLVVVGVAYSFWRISKVASPTLDVPPSPEPATSQAG